MSSTIRKRVLPTGWYPTTERETRQLLDQWREEYFEKEGELDRKAVSAVVPHAGWSFSGKIAFHTIMHLKEEVDTVVVVGGHMHKGEGVVVAEEEGYETPFGTLEADGDLHSALSGAMKVKEDRFPDNTVEVNLPFIPYLFPRSNALWVRVGSGEEAKELGRVCAAVAEKVGKKVVLIGSTDLTHYGPSYGFTPVGTGKSAYEWVKNENDAAIVDAMRLMDSDAVLQHGNVDKAACSAGAAAAAIEFARAYRVESGVLQRYGSSYELYPGDSFVGYAGLYYSSAES